MGMIISFRVPAMLAGSAILALAACSSGKSEAASEASTPVAEKAAPAAPAKADHVAATGQAGDKGEVAVEERRRLRGIGGADRRAVRLFMGEGHQCSFSCVHMSSSFE